MTTLRSLKSRSCLGGFSKLVSSVGAAFTLSAVWSDLVGSAFGACLKVCAVVEPPAGRCQAQGGGPAPRALPQAGGHDLKRSSGRPMTTRARVLGVVGTSARQQSTRGGSPREAVVTSTATPPTLRLGEFCTGCYNYRNQHFSMCRMTALWLAARDANGDRDDSAI